MGMFNISTYRKHQLKQPRRFAVIRKTDIVYNKHFHLRDLNSCHCRLYYQHQYRVQPTERIKGNYWSKQAIPTTYIGNSEYENVIRGQFVVISDYFPGLPLPLIIFSRILVATIHLSTLLLTTFSQARHPYGIIASVNN